MAPALRIKSACFFSTASSLPLTLLRYCAPRSCAIATPSFESARWYSGGRGSQAILTHVLRPPTFRELPRYPITVGLALGAIAVSLAMWSGRDMSMLTCDVRISHGQPWRLLTSTLVHANLLHL